MNVPGLQLTEPNETEYVATHELGQGCEWRFEVAFGESVEVKLLSGTAEVFGTELPLGQKHTFSGTKLAIFTYHGCVLETRGRPPTVEYTAEETPMTPYANLHFALERLRQNASPDAPNNIADPDSPTNIGPRVMILGPDDAGKTSLAKILTAYAVRAGRRPCVVNLDPREGVLSLPGTLTATTFSTIMDVEEGESGGWGSSPTSGPSAVPVKLPLVYYYGFESPDGNRRLYRKIVARMALAVTSRLGEDREAQSSGLILDTPGHLSHPSSYDLIQHAVSDFSLTVLVILGSERLYSDMLRRFSTRLTVLKLPKSGGCVDRDPNHHLLTRQRSLRTYFFGDPKRTLSPYTMTVDSSTLDIYRIADESSTRGNTSLLPGGVEEGQVTFPLLEKSEVSALLTHSVLAVLHCGVGERVEDMAESCVMGFVYVVEVEEQKRRMKILAPVAGRLPARPLVVGYFPEATINLVG